MIKSPHPALDLSFMRPKPEGGGIDYWNVTTAGSYTADYERGKELAGEYLDYLGQHPTNFNSTLLGCIVQDMGAPKSGLMLGFMRVVNGYAMAAARVVHAGQQSAPDPIIAAIEAYYEGARQFNLLPDDLENEQANVDLWRKPWDVLTSWDRPCTTRESAIAALKFAADEGHHDGYEIAPVMMRAALSYLEREGE